MKNSVQSFIVNYLMHHDEITKPEAIKILQQMQTCILQGIPIEEVFHDVMISLDDLPYSLDIIACNLISKR